MPQIETETITVSLPENWSTFADGNQLVAQGPDGEELIVSRAKLTGTGSGREELEVLTAAKDRLIESIRRAASHPDLVTVAGETENVISNRVTLIRCSSISTDGAIQFDQFGIVIPPEMIYVTHEAPASSHESRSLIERAIRDSIERCE